jgi:hypothetical protein
MTNINPGIWWARHLTVCGIAKWAGWKFVSCLLAILVAAYMTYFAIVRPGWAWDVIPYTMAVLKSGASDVATAHAKTYALIAAYAPADMFAILTSSDQFRQGHFANPGALASYLPLWECKLGYVLLLKAIAAFSDPIVAIIAVSLMAILATLAIMLWQSWKLAGIASLAWLPLMVVFGMPTMASMLSPDPVTTLVYTAGFAAFLSARWRVASALFVIAVFLRPDSVVTNAVLAVAMVARAPREAVVVLLGSLGAYLLDIAVTDHVGWWGQVYLSFISPPSELTGFRPPFSLSAYLSILAKSSLEMLHLKWVFDALGIAILAAIMLTKRPNRPAEILLLALVVGMQVRFVAYPSPEIRHYTPALFGLCLIVLRVGASLVPFPVGRHVP